MSKGPLIKVQIGPHRYAKMYRDDAIAQGLIQEAGSKKPKVKQRRPAADKMRRGPGRNKQVATEPITGMDSTSAGAFIVPEDTGIYEPDDFAAIIRGIGAATAEKLHAHGILTFEQLAQADVSWLPGLTRRAVEEWRKKREKETACRRPER